MEWVLDAEPAGDGELDLRRRVRARWPHYAPAMGRRSRKRSMAGTGSATGTPHASAPRAARPAVAPAAERPAVAAPVFVALAFLFRSRWREASELRSLHR